MEGKRLLFRLYAILILALASAGCNLVAGIFKAGMWFGIILVVLVIVGLMMLFRRRG